MGCCSKFDFGRPFYKPLAVNTVPVLLIARQKQSPVLFMTIPLQGGGSAFLLGQRLLMPCVTGTMPSLFSDEEERRLPMLIMLSLQHAGR